MVPWEQRSLTMTDMSNLRQSEWSCSPICASSKMSPQNQGADLSTRPTQLHRAHQRLGTKSVSTVSPRGLTRLRDCPHRRYWKAIRATSRTGTFGAIGEAIKLQVLVPSLLRVERRGNRVTERILQEQPSLAVTAQRLSYLAYNCKAQIQTREHQGRAMQEAPTAETMIKMPTITTYKTSRARTVQFDPLQVKINPCERLLASRLLRHRMTSKEISQEHLLVSLEKLTPAWLNRHMEVWIGHKGKMLNTRAPGVKDTSSNLVKIGRALLINHLKGR